jgi:hypothetical protein
MSDALSQLFNRRLRGWSVVTFVAAFFVILLMTQLLDPDAVIVTALIRDKSKSPLEAKFVFAFAGAAGMYVLSRYLADSKEFKVHSKSDYDDLRAKIDLLSKVPQATGNNALDIDELVKAIQPTLQGVMLRKVSEYYSAADQKIKLGEVIAREFDAVISRLEHEIRALTKRGNVNLTIGVFASTVALGLLISLTYGGGIAVSPGDAPSLTVWQRIALNLVPKATVAVFVELLAYFFLGQYRRALNELYTYHSDMTRVTLQRVAVQAAMAAEEPGAKAALSKDLLAAAPMPKAPVVDEKAGSSDARFDKVMETMLTALAKGVGEKIKLDGKGKKEEKSE